MFTLGLTGLTTVLWVGNGDQIFAQSELGKSSAVNLRQASAKITAEKKEETQLETEIEVIPSEQSQFIPIVFTEQIKDIQEEVNLRKRVVENIKTSKPSTTQPKSEPQAVVTERIVFPKDWILDLNGIWSATLPYNHTMTRDEEQNIVKFWNKVTGELEGASDYSMIRHHVSPGKVGGLNFAYQEIGVSEEKSYSTAFRCPIALDAHGVPVDGYRCEDREDPEELPDIITHKEWKDEQDPYVYNFAGRTFTDDYAEKKVAYNVNLGPDLPLNIQSNPRSILGMDNYNTYAAPSNSFLVNVISFGDNGEVKPYDVGSTIVFLRKEVYQDNGYTYYYVIQLVDGKIITIDEEGHLINLSTYRYKWN